MTIKKGGKIEEKLETWKVGISVHYKTNVIMEPPKRPRHSPTPLSSKPASQRIKTEHMELFLGSEYSQAGWHHFSLF